MRSFPGVRQNRSIPAPTVIRIQIGENHRSQLNVGDGGAVIVGDIRGTRRPPRENEVTHSVIVRVEDVDAHCACARTHGALIVDEPQTFPYGERQYTAQDPAGHQWTFSESVADVHPDEWGGTLKISD
jgi:uncharacterized glyoxalase superfamily protein PhnB